MPRTHIAHRHHERNSWDRLSRLHFEFRPAAPKVTSKGAAVKGVIARPGPACAASLGIRALVAAIAILGASIGSASAQDWPTRPIRLVVGASAGGGTDISARLIAQPLAEILGQAVVVENRAGAAGTTA